MRVAYVSPTAGVHDRRFVNAWRDSGVDVTPLVVDSDPDEDLAARLEAARADVVHAGPIHTAAWQVLRCWDGPLIAMSWGFDLMQDVDQGDQPRRRATDVLARADVVIVDNDAVREKAHTLGASLECVAQFPWGVEHGLFTARGADLRHEYGLAKKDEVILSVRNHEELYDVETLAVAFVEVARLRPRARLIIGGSGSRTSRLQQILRDGSAADKSTFTGTLSGARLAALYRSADIYVSTSRTDGTSISLLEAMASGPTPVVTDIPGNRQWVTPDVGFLFPVGDWAALASSVVCALNDVSEARQARSEAAQLMVQNHADWSKAPAILRDLADHAVTHAGTRGGKS